MIPFTPSQLRLHLHRLSLENVEQLLSICSQIVHGINVEALDNQYNTLSSQALKWSTAVLDAHWHRVVISTASPLNESITQFARQLSSTTSALQPLLALHAQLSCVMNGRTLGRNENEATRFGSEKYSIEVLKLD
jgi:hypothetical protein